MFPVLVVNLSRIYVGVELAQLGNQDWIQTCAMDATLPFLLLKHEDQSQSKSEYLQEAWDTRKTKMVLAWKSQHLTRVSGGGADGVGGVP